MSQSAEKIGQEPLVQPSKFGKRFAIIVATVLLILAAVAGVGMYAVGDGGGQSSPQPTKPSNSPFN